MSIAADDLATGDGDRERPLPQPGLPEDDVRDRGRRRLRRVSQEPHQSLLHPLRGDPQGGLRPPHLRPYDDGLRSRTSRPCRSSSTTRRAFFSRYYRPDNVGAGDRRLDRRPATMAMVRKYYGAWEAGYVAPQVEPEPPQTAERRIDVSYEGKLAADRLDRLQVDRLRPGRRHPGRRRRCSAIWPSARPARCLQEAGDRRAGRGIHLSRPQRQPRSGPDRRLHPGQGSREGRLRDLRARPGVAEAQAQAPDAASASRT